MALQLRRSTSMRVRLMTTLIAAFALIAQPMYGLVASQVANAASANIDNVVLSPLTATINTNEVRGFTLKFRHGTVDEALDSSATVELSTSSATGEFADGTSVANPWTHTASYATGAA